MKTKTIITTFLLLFSISSFAQTEVETISWIKEKLEKHGGWSGPNFNSTYTNVKVSPCHISFTDKYSDGSEKLHSFNPSTAKSWKVIRDSTPGIEADAEIIRQVYSDGGIYNISVLFIRNGESDIHERMIKALLHLATFCEEGKNEAF
ncbi:MAG TPA: hypothetical protein VLY87_02615 [Flavobacterium sp.]|nr:hypothetical protein [Flavobacterium sp.]